MKIETAETNAQAPTRKGSGTWRIAGAIAPAAIITAGLFVTMHALVTVDEVEVAEKETRTLGVITPKKRDPNIIRTERIPPSRIDVATPPPPPAQYRVGPDEIDFPLVNVAGKVPNFDRTGQIKITPPGRIGISRDLIAIRPPAASYPSREQSRGIEGNCEVSFDLSTRGNPFNVTAVCTSDGFEREAVRAVSKAEFAPKVSEGQPVEAYGLVYPLEFRLQ